MVDRLKLPSNPETFPAVAPEEFERLKAQSARLWMPGNCWTCDGTGAFRTEVEGEIAEYECDCLAQWQLHIVFESCGLGLHYQRLGWAHLDLGSADPRAVQAILDYTDTSVQRVKLGQALTLWGRKRGTGKTMLAALLLKNLVASGADGYFCRFTQLINLYAAGWRDNQARAWFERRVMNASILVVDDIGKESARQWEMVSSLVDEMLRSRVASARPTFVTTNLAPDQISERYYQDVLELFAGHNTMVEVGGSSYRQTYADRMERYARKGLIDPVTIQ